MIDYDALAAQFGGATDTAVPTKAFVGIISQGTLGAPQDFTPQESGLIESMDDLQKAAHLNGANLFASLPGRLRYAIHFANSFNNLDGSVETATSQQIITGYSAKGVPKYKTVRNKFAILTITLIGDLGQKHKIKDINLGPVDAAAVNPTPVQLGDLGTSIQANLVSSDTADFNTLVSPTPTTIVNIAPSPAVETTVDVQAIAAQLVPKLPIGTLTPTDQANQEAAQLANLQAELQGKNVVISNNPIEAASNQIPVRFFYSGPGKVGYPAILYVGGSPNVPYGTVEVGLLTAQNYIKSTPDGYLVETTQDVGSVLNRFHLTRDNQDDIYSKILIISALNYQNIASAQILSGQLPPTGYVWAYKDKNGHLLTNVSLSDIQTGKV